MTHSYTQPDRLLLLLSLVAATALVVPVLALTAADALQQPTKLRPVSVKDDHIYNSPLLWPMRSGIGKRCICRCPVVAGDSQNSLFEGGQFEETVVCLLFAVCFIFPRSSKSIIPSEPLATVYTHMRLILQHRFSDGGLARNVVMD